MPAVKGVGEPCAGEPHARFEVAAGGDRCQSATAARRLAPPADPTREEYLIVDRGTLAGAGAHSYSAGDATGGSDEAARFRDR